MHAFESCQEDENKEENRGRLRWRGGIKAEGDKGVGVVEGVRRAFRSRSD